MARLLSVANPAHGPHVTNVILRFSWHQWGEACDCRWFVDGKSRFAPTDPNAPSTEENFDLEGYRVYADEAEKLGLTAGGHWTYFEDWEHVQYRKTDNLSGIYSTQEINEAMIEKFGHLYRR